MGHCAASKTIRWYSQLSIGTSFPNCFCSSSRACLPFWDERSIDCGNPGLDGDDQKDLLAGFIDGHSLSQSHNTRTDTGNRYSRKAKARHGKCQSRIPAPPRARGEREKCQTGRIASRPTLTRASPTRRTICGKAERKRALVWTVEGSRRCQSVRRPLPQPKTG